MLAIVGRILIIILWSVLFIENLRCIVKDKIDADTGVLWAVAIGALQICLGVINVKWAEYLGRPSTLIMEIEQFVLTCILYNHELEITEMRKKNNELAIQLSLIKEQVKSIEEAADTPE